jgi:Na+/melibiose symporter-like transporter
LAFPFFVVGMIPFRLSFRLIFSKEELDAVTTHLNYLHIFGLLEDI